MKYYIGLADDGRTVCSVGYDETGETIGIECDKEIDELAFGGYEYVDGRLIRNEKKYNEYKLCQLRNQREEECFPIINRGELWYSMLEDFQLEELKTWYLAWLDVTKTKEIPVKPNWLN